ncbi:unnamed protein product [Meganyctiphanes norvegica]|uniref:Uncharacterized protein n=1 Tax=Meganyctiphanes norvegica TaxID=48144 RepID=A0AAV2PT15_MEGNR
MHLMRYANDSFHSDKMYNDILIQDIKKIMEEKNYKMNQHHHLNEIYDGEQPLESIILQEIKKIQNEEIIQEHYEETLFTKWFFKMSRDSGGSARFECMGIQLPLSLDITYLFWILVFIVPVIGFCLIIPALRKKACASFIVVVMFSSTGLALITGLLTTSWLVGEVEGKMTIGPLNTRCNTRVGMWVGLSTINVTLERTNMFLNERISINDNVILHADQKHAMMAGWPWPILLVIEYLTGEGRNWSGTLGFYLNRAGRSVYLVLYLSTGLWVVCLVCFTIAAHLACKPLILSGVLELLAAMIYAMQVHIFIAPYIIIEGNKLQFSLGWSWWLTLFLGLLHISCGIVLFAYEYFRPGKLSTIFEVDFGFPTHRLEYKKKIYDENNNEYAPDNTDEEFDTEDYESSTYESFHEPNSLQPSPNLTEMDPPNLDGKVCSTPTLSHTSSKSLLHNFDFPITAEKGKSLKRSILFQDQHSTPHRTPHRIYVH